MSTKLPQTLIEAIRYFTDLNVCTEFVAKLRWADGWTCENCGGIEYTYISTRRLWKCKDCKKQTSVKRGTIFEDSPLGLDKWLPALWLIANSKNGISSHELGRALGVTQKSAWFMLHRIRLAMQTGSFDKFDGEVEVDETFIGGLARAKSDSHVNGGCGQMSTTHWTTTMRSSALMSASNRLSRGRKLRNSLRAAMGRRAANRYRASVLRVVPSPAERAELLSDPNHPVRVVHLRRAAS